MVAGGLSVAATVGAWAAGEGNIDHTETKAGSLRILYSIPELPEGVEPDLASLEVTVNDAPLKASADLAASADASEQVRRTAILAIDTSNSMRGDRFEQAKAAAKAFLESAPRDVQVGIVAFAGSVEVVQPPSLDRDAAAAVIDDLSLSLQTRLYDGVIAATQAAGSEGQRSLLVLSDGRDTSDTELKEVIDAISATKVRVDVVALGEAAEANAPLESMASEGDGTVVAAQDPDALTALFSDEAAALARQVLISAPLPDDSDTTEGSVAVSIDAGGETYSDTAFVTFGDVAQRPKKESAAAQPTAPPSPLVNGDMLLAGLAALGVGGMVVLLGAFGVLGKAKKESLEQQISAYTRAGAAKNASGRQSAAQGQSKNVASSAVEIAQKALEGNKTFEGKLAGKLEGADISLKPAEWILVQAGIAIGAGLIGFLLSAGGILLTVVMVFVGAVLPWLILGIKKSRRLKAFNAQLPETLQLISGSLSAGLSLAQSMDTVVREGTDPVAGEFRRALVEARLGVQVEDSLDSIAKRMESADFEWVVMAIRIQREVGGNLAELLLQVAKTMREREYLRRQVKTLSAEGKLSAYILGALPPGMLLYMLGANPAYLAPMFANLMGWVMLGGAAVLMAVGAFWMSRVVKVDV
jgi:tight adherence protein B